MAGVRDGGVERLREFGEAACALLAHLPPALRVLDETVVVAEVGLAVLGPEAFGAAEGGDAALGGEAGADEGDDVTRGSDEPRSVLDSAIEPLIPLPPIVWKSHSATTLTMTVRSRGPSNSARKMPCQRPRARRPFSIGIAADWLTSVALMWAWALPSS